jgi:hypothetical protein
MGVELCLSSLWDKQTLRVFEDKMLRKIFGFRRDYAQRK